MEVVIVNQQEVGALLPMRECIDVMERVFRSLADGDCSLPLRQIMWLPEKIGALGLMPSPWGSAPSLTTPGLTGTLEPAPSSAVRLLPSQAHPERPLHLPRPHHTCAPAFYGTSTPRLTFVWRSFHSASSKASFTWSSGYRLETIL